MSFSIKIKKKIKKIYINQIFFKKTDNKKTKRNYYIIMQKEILNISRLELTTLNLDRRIKKRTRQNKNLLKAIS